VSLKTVSRVVNSEPGVRPETAALVSEAIERLGFRRNAVARALRRGQPSHMLGLVIEDVSNPFYSKIFRGVEEIARNVGFLVITASSGGDPEREPELVKLLCERRVDGLLVVPAADNHRYLLPEVGAGTGLVFIDRPPALIDADAVLLDNVGGARSAVRHLLELGHRRIAMIGDEKRIFTAAERLHGYRDALAAAGQPFDPSLVRLGAHDADQRAALVGFDDFELAESLATPTTVVAYDAEELGRKAAELLLLRLAGDQRPPQRVVLPTRLVERESGALRP
jgi:LacI family transcriptional regulator